MEVVQMEPCIKLASSIIFHSGFNLCNIEKGLNILPNLRSHIQVELKHKSSTKLF